MEAGCPKSQTSPESESGRKYPARVGATTEECAQSKVPLACDVSCPLRAFESTGELSVPCLCCMTCMRLLERGVGERKG
eukprot:837056-Rhodomonas_salina.1